MIDGETRSQEDRLATHACRNDNYRSFRAIPLVYLMGGMLFLYRCTGPDSLQGSRQQLMFFPMLPRRQVSIHT